MSKEFTLFDKTITFTDKQIARAEIIQRFGFYADAAEEITKIAYLNKINSYEDLIADNGSIIQIVVNMFFEPTMKFIVDNGIYDFSDKDLLSRFNQINSISNQMEDLLEPFDEIIQANASAQQYRELRKESRGRVVGGGFGFEGAVKGMAAAGAMNAAAGIGHSIFNSIGNALDNASAQDAMKKFFQDESLIHKYVRIAFDAVTDISVVVLDLFEKKNLVASNGVMSNENDALFENLKKGRIPKQEIPQIFLGLIQKAPYRRLYYDWGLDNLPEYKETLLEMGCLMCYIPDELSTTIKKVEDLTVFDKFVFDRVKDLLGVDYVAQLIAPKQNTDGNGDGQTLILNEKQKEKVEQKKERENSLCMGTLCGLAWVILALAGLSYWIFEPIYGGGLSLWMILDRTIMSFVTFIFACVSVLISLGVVGNCLVKTFDTKHPTIKAFTVGDVFVSLFTIAPVFFSISLVNSIHREKTAYVLLAFIAMTVFDTLCGILQLLVRKIKGNPTEESSEIVAGKDSATEEKLIESSVDVENKDAVDVVLVAYDAKNKMDVLKAVRSIAGLDLAGARAVVEKSNSIVKANVPKANAEMIKKDLEKLGAKVVFR